MLARFLGTTKGTASQTAKALENKGCVLRVRDPSDGRAVRLEVTQAGRNLLDLDPPQILAGVVEGLPAEGGSRFADCIDSVLAGLRERGHGCEFGVCTKCGYFSRPDGPDGARCGLFYRPVADAETGHLCAGFMPVGDADEGQADGDRPEAAGVAEIAAASGTALPARHPTHPPRAAS